jgi:glycosyltransferase involved in cell wall biosynthesis
VSQLIVYEGALDPASFGGARFHFLGVAGALTRRRDVEVVLVTPLYPESEEWPAVPGATHLKLPVGTKSIKALLLYEFRKAKVFMNLRRQYGAGGVLLTRLGVANWSAAFARLLGYRVILEVNGRPSDELKDRGFGAFVRAGVATFTAVQFRSAHSFVAVTEGIAKRLADHTHSLITVIPNGSDPPQPYLEMGGSPEAGAVPPGSSESPLLVYVGALAPWQDLDLTLAVLRRLRDSSNLEWRLAVVGDGEGRDDFLRTVQTLGLANAVHWLGWQSRPEVARILAKADVGVVPLRAKAGSGVCGSPLKLFEYLAAGIPVVSSDVDGVRELEYPLLFTYPEGNVEAFAHACEKARAIRRVTGNELLQMQKAVSWDGRVEQLFAAHLPRTQRTGCVSPAAKS